jgi:lipopolysaccharide/colanic/teichoic acid biosynthesis glycosyltransferase
MRLYPVLIDDRPAYLNGRDDLSLLLMPVGSATVLDLLRRELAGPTSGRVKVVTRFAPSAAYRDALEAAGLRPEDVLEAAEFAARLDRYEPSDWLILRDARFVGAQPLGLTELFDDLSLSHRAARHVVALAGTSGGTSERVLLDARGQVSRIQRYYEGITWPFASAVALSAVPVAGTLGLVDCPVSCLPSLRSCLTAQGVPARDFFADRTVFDLGHESGLLALTERLLLDVPSTERCPWVSPQAAVDPTARLRGLVRAEPGAVIGEGAVVIGPALLGRASRVGGNAFVAHCLVAPGAAVPAGSVMRHQVVSLRDGRPRPATDPGLVSPVESLRMRQEVVEPPRDGATKRVLDVVLALLGLVFLAPLLALLAAIVKLDSRGPVLYGDQREGRHGRRFRCWKLRTMQAGAATRQEELLAGNQVDGPQFKMTNDPRVTRVGRWLRKLNLDEIPQLLNVVRGEMSLVGPRPSPFRENQICIPWREGRLSVRPGITGLWQVCRHDRAGGDFHQWIYFDLLYVQHLSTWLDLKILAATVLTLGGRYPASPRWLLPPSTHREPRLPEAPRETRNA